MPLPPPRQVVLSLLVERLHLKVPQWVGLVVLAVSVPTGAWMVLRGEGVVPHAQPGPVVAQQWATDSATRLLAAVVTGALPAPDPRQRKPPCDPDIEREFDGYCWVALKVTPPCPIGKAWERDGACYARALQPVRLPTTGGAHPENVAGEQQ